MRSTIEDIPNQIIQNTNTETPHITNLLSCVTIFFSFYFFLFLFYEEIALQRGARLADFLFPLNIVFSFGLYLSLFRSLYIQYNKQSTRNINAECQQITTKSLRPNSAKIYENIWLLFFDKIASAFLRECAVC